MWSSIYVDTHRYNEVAGEERKKSKVKESKSGGRDSKTTTNNERLYS